MRTRFLAYRWPTSLCVLTWWGAESGGKLSCLFLQGHLPHSRSTHPHDLIPSQGAHLLMLSHWGSGCQQWIWGVTNILSTTIGLVEERSDDSHRGWGAPGKEFKWYEWAPASGTRHQICMARRAWVQLRRRGRGWEGCTRGWESFQELAHQASSRQEGLWGRNSEYQQVALFQMCSQRRSQTVVWASETHWSRSSPAHCLTRDAPLLSHPATKREALSPGEW